MIENKEDEKLSLDQNDSVELPSQEVIQVPKVNETRGNKSKISENFLINNNINTVFEKSQSKIPNFLSKKIEIIDTDDNPETNFFPFSKNETNLTIYPAMNLNQEKDHDLKKEFQDLSINSIPVKQDIKFSTYFYEAEEILKKLNLYENDELRNYIFKILNHTRNLEDKIKQLNQQILRNEEEIKNYRTQYSLFNNNHDLQVSESEVPSFNFPSFKHTSRPYPSLNYFNQNKNQININETNNNNYFGNNDHIPNRNVKNSFRNCNQFSNPRNNTFNFRENFTNRKFPDSNEDLNEMDGSSLLFNKNNKVFRQLEKKNDNKRYFKNLNIEKKYDNNYENIHFANIQEEEIKEIKKEEKVHTILSDGMMAAKLQFEEYNSTEDNRNRNLHDLIDFSQLSENGNDEFFLPNASESSEINIPKEIEEIQGLRKYQINKLINRTEIKKKFLDLNIQCNICLQSYDMKRNYCKMDCTHCFHKECISTWLETKAICPICKIIFR